MITARMKYARVIRRIPLAQENEPWIGQVGKVIEFEETGLGVLVTLDFDGERVVFESRDLAPAQAPVREGGSHG